MKQLICCIGLVTALCLPVCAADIAGTWKFSVDLETHEHGDPTFVLKQNNNKLCGTYDGPFGHEEVTGVVTADKAHLEVISPGPGGSVKLTYEARIESPTKMTGTMTRNINGESTPGKWTATKTK
jgi:hypothetical protein